MKKIILSIIDPISTFTTKSLPEKIYKLLNKSFLIQITFALVITILLFLLK